jgi:hypothetical protein
MRPRVAHRTGPLELKDEVRPVRLLDGDPQLAADLDEDERLAARARLVAPFGRVRPERIVIPLPLTREVVARLAGATRPSVSTALKRLERDGAISKHPDGGFVLHGEPPDLARAGERRRASRLRRPGRVSQPTAAVTLLRGFRGGRDPAGCVPCPARACSQVRTLVTLPALQSYARL